VQLQEEELQEEELQVAEGVQFLELLQYLGVPVVVAVLQQEELQVVVFGFPLALQEVVPVVVLQEVRHLPYLPIHH
jgi:hypothetical protein